MIYFNSNNIFKTPKYLTHELFNPYFPLEEDLVWQASIASTKSIVFQKYSLIDSAGNGYVQNFSDITVKYAFKTGLYYLLGKTFILDTQPQGYYQIRIEYTDAGTPKTLYSNFFYIGCPDEAVYYLLINDSTDFDNKIYSSHYQDILYFRPDCISIESFLQEKTKETGSITEDRESQIFCEQATLKLKCDKYGKKYIDKLPLFDNIRIYYEEYNMENILDRVDIVSSEYNEDLQIYEIEIEFKVNEIIKSYAEVLTVTELELNGKQVTINDSGDVLTINDSGDILYSQDPLI